MPEARKCPRCGTPLDAGAVAGLCPACLLQQGAAADTVTGAKAPPFQPPAVAELAAKFPQLEILELIGKGGMGAVYKARQKELDRIVALKILPPGIGDDPAFAERFAREAKALAKLNHPGIVTIYDFGRADGLFYFLMEFVDGVNLRQLLKAGRISPREALAIVPQICDALQFAHDQGIVHRDIKPENILLDRRGRVKVADFGLAKIVEGNVPRTPSLSSSDRERVAKPGEGSPVLTAAGNVMGTPNYMAPEQQEHPDAVDHRADIYALGVVFYQMLTGELPGKEIEPPSSKVQIDVRLDEVVLRALEKEPERRYQQVSEVKTQVETIAAGTGEVVAGNWQPEWPARRSPRIAVGVVFALIALLSLILVLAVHEQVLSFGPSRIITLNVTLIRLLGASGAVIFGWLAVLQLRRANSDPAPLRAVESWLALMDRGDYAQSWEAAAKRFQRAITRQEWGERLQSARRPQGAVISRRLRTARRFAGRCTAIFDTAFAGLAAAVETVTFVRERDGGWRAIGYLILPAYAETAAAPDDGRGKGKSPMVRIVEFLARRKASEGTVVMPAGGVFQDTGLRLLLMVIAHLVLFEVLIHISVHWKWKESTEELWLMTLGAATLGGLAWAFWPGYRRTRSLLFLALATVVSAALVLAVDNFYAWQVRPRLGFAQEPDRAGQLADELKTDYFSQAHFPRGDSIQLASVERSADRMVVKGHYNLVSADSAVLGLYISSTNKDVPEGERQRMPILRGAGNFELIDSHLVPGLPHVSMYDGDGKPFAEVYFGTRAEVSRITGFSKTNFADNYFGTDVRGESERNPGRNQAAFGPVIERVLNDLNEEQGNAALRFRTGELTSPPPGGRKDIQPWLITNRMDLLVSRVNGRWALLSHGLRLGNASSADWAAASPAQMLTALMTGPNLEHPTNVELADRLFLLPENVELPFTLAFQTAERDQGFLQITGFADNPRGVKIRYKLVQNGTTGTSVGQNPGPAGNANFAVVANGSPPLRYQWQLQEKNSPAASKNPSYGPVIEKVTVQTNEAFVVGETKDGGELVLTIGNEGLSWNSELKANMPFRAVIKPDRDELRFDVSNGIGPSLSTVENHIALAPNGRLPRGQMIFREGTYSPASEGVVIADFQPEAGEPLPVLVSVRKADAVPSQTLSFGPVIERFLSAISEPPYNELSYLDLDSGNLLSLSQANPPVDPFNAEQYFDWRQKSGADVVAQIINDPTNIPARFRVNFRGLVGLKTLLIPADKSAWDNMPPEPVVAAVAPVKPDTTRWTMATTLTNGLPATHLFKTSEGGMGILQILGFSDNPRGVKIRYKLVQPTWVNWNNGQKIGSFYAVAGTKTETVAVGIDGRIATRNNATGVWTVQTFTGDPDFRAIVHAQGQYVAVRERGSIMTSPDGIAWTQRVSPTTENLLGLFWDGHQYLAGGDHGTMLASPDGIKWEKRDSGSDISLYSFSYSGSRYVAVGNDGMLVSTDSVTWTTPATRWTTEHIPFTACTWTGTEFLACGLGLDNFPTIYASPAGDSWTLRDTTIKSSLRAAVTINGAIYVAGDSVIEKSTDGGTTWQDTFINPTGNNNLFMGLAYDGKCLIAVGFNHNVWALPVSSPPRQGRGGNP